jgi:hypothetical protein
MAEGPDRFKAEAVAIGGRINTTGKLSFTKQTSSQWVSGS